MPSPGPGDSMRRGSHGVREVWEAGAGGCAQLCFKECMHIFTAFQRGQKASIHSQGARSYSVYPQIKASGQPHLPLLPKEGKRQLIYRKKLGFALPGPLTCHMARPSLGSALSLAFRVCKMAGSLCLDFCRRPDNGGGWEGTSLQ